MEWIAKTLWIVLFILSIQMYVGCIWINESDDNFGLSSARFWLMSYIVGGTITQALFLTIHELAHNSAFGGGYLLNRILALVANLPVLLPYSVSFKVPFLLHTHALNHTLTTAIKTNRVTIWHIIGIRALSPTMSIFQRLLRLPC